MGSDEKMYQKLQERIEKHEVDSVEKFDKLVAAQQANTDSISELTRSVSSLVEDTSSIIQLHKDFQGTVRVGKSVQGFMVWCLKWGAIGAGVVAIMNWLIEHFK